MSRDKAPQQSARMIAKFSKSDGKNRLFFKRTLATATSLHIRLPLRASPVRSETDVEVLGVQLMLARALGARR
jgi:hypothetical protein